MSKVIKYDLENHKMGINLKRFEDWCKNWLDTAHKTLMTADQMYPKITKFIRKNDSVLTDADRRKIIDLLSNYIKLNIKCNVYNSGRNGSSRRIWTMAPIRP